MILKDYVKGELRKNKKIYKSTVITIFLAVLVLATFVFGVFSYYKSYRDLIGKTTGGYHFRIVSEISKKDAKSLRNNRHIKKLGLFSSELLGGGFGSKEKLMLLKMDDNAFSTIESWIKEGSLPRENEIMVSNDMARELGKSIGDRLEIKGEAYKISAIYYDITYEFDEVYNVYLNIPQEKLLASEESFSPFIWYKNIFRTYSLSEKLMENLETKDITYNYNTFYLDRSFSFDPDDDFLKDHTFQIILIALFLILLALFYFIIKNLFLLQERKSIREYAKLKSLGARNKDIGKIISLKVLYLSEIPIIAGIIFSAGLVKFLFLFINKTEEYFFKTKGIVQTGLDLDLAFNIKLGFLIYLLASFLIYITSKKPMKKLRGISIARGLKGEVQERAYKKYDLQFKGRIERDLSKQFYKNSRRNFFISGISLKLGFALMSFIIIIVTYVSMEEKYNNLDKYRTYNIQGRYASLLNINDDMISDLEALGLDDLINFRSENVYIDYDEELIDGGYIGLGSLPRLEEEISDFKNLRLNIIGLEDGKFREFSKAKGLDPEEYFGNSRKVILLNTMGTKFDLPRSKIRTGKFLDDGVKTLNLSEYGQVLKTRGYEFSLDVQAKIYEPLFDYPLRKDILNCYMPKSEYNKLVDSFEKIADLDQFEYLAIKSKNLEEDQDLVKKISLDYFKDRDFDLESKIDEENLREKRNIIGSILVIFFSLFFIVIGFSNAYFASYNLFLNRREELLLYRTIGMDRKLLKEVLSRERNRIIINFIYPMPIIFIALSFILASSSKAFSTLDILREVNYIYIVIYILVTCLAMVVIYDRSSKEIIG